GCAAQIEPDTFAGMAEVDRVIGNGNKLSRAVWDETRRALASPPGLVEREAKAEVSDIFAVTETVPHLASGFAGPARAFVQVQNGCDHRCTFCVIPYGRGNARSAPMGAAVAAVRAAVEGGAREVVLTGVDLTS